MGEVSESVEHEWKYVGTLFWDAKSELRSYKCTKCGLSASSRTPAGGEHVTPTVGESCTHHLISGVMEK